MSDTQPICEEVRAALLFVLWHHQGGSSSIGQSIRLMLGIGEHEHLSPEQLSMAKTVASVQKDAERYRWLRAIYFDGMVASHYLGRTDTPAEMDAAIDQSMKADRK